MSGEWVSGVARRQAFAHCELSRSSNEALGYSGRIRPERRERKPSFSPTTKFARAGFNRPARVLPGDHIGKETPVPIPNTVVKLSEPMIVQQTRK